MFYGNGIAVFCGVTFVGVLWWIMMNDDWTHKICSIAFWAVVFILIVDAIMVIWGWVKAAFSFTH
jgi:hypothetical protein